MGLKGLMNYFSNLYKSHGENYYFRGEESGREGWRERVREKESLSWKEPSTCPGRAQHHRRTLRRRMSLKVGF
jgi:hypothetical protein